MIFWIQTEAVRGAKGPGERWARPVPLHLNGSSRGRLQFLAGGDEIHLARAQNRHLANAHL